MTPPAGGPRHGAGRPKTINATRAVTLALDEHTHHLLTNLEKRWGVNKSEVVRRLLMQSPLATEPLTEEKKMRVPEIRAKILRWIYETLQGQPITQYIGQFKLMLCDRDANNVQRAPEDTALIGAIDGMIRSTEIILFKNGVQVEPMNVEAALWGAGDFTIMPIHGYARQAYESL